MSASAAVSPDELLAALERDTAGAVKLRETHISWVMLTPDRAYKLKKPLVLPFLDYGTPARRRAMCEAEVRLNATLAPDVYLGVRSVLRAAGGVELAAEDAEGAIDYLVEMRRYDERDTLASKLDRGELLGAEVATVARRLAEFHAHCPVVVSDAQRARAEVDRNLGELLAVAELHAERHRIASLARLLRAFIGARSAELRERASRGCTRECHGDLRAEHVLLEQSVGVVDCVEFDRELRTLDTADDLAFLVMDLTALGGERFARELVERYREAGGDCGDDALLAFYAVHRALVRAKVLLVRAAQAPSASAAHGRASAVARELLALAERFGWRARLPLAIVVCGGPATGKSFLAHELAEASRLPWLSSDLIRKRLAGLAPTQRGSRELYRAEANRATYEELGRRAAGAVREQGGAIVDATFRHRADREAFAASFAGAAPLRYIECRVPEAVLAERAAARERDPHHVSDATVEVVMRERDRWEPLEEIPSQARTALATDRPLGELVEDVNRWLDATF